MPRSLHIIKPSRLTEQQPTLSEQVVKDNLARGIETSVVLDLSVLNHFANALDPKSTMSAGERQPAEMEAILRIPFLFLSPGIALGEADEKYLEHMRCSFEEYLKKFFPSYTDAPNALGLRPRGESRRFAALPEVDQKIFSVAYLALLRIHDILLSNPGSSGEAKFDMFLEYMDRVANFVPALEAEVAKFCFSGKASPDDPAFERLRESIKDNFNKGGRGDKRLMRILNGVRDVMYLRFTGIMDGKELSGKQQDTWLLTCDDGLASLARAAYFYPKDGEAAKYFTVSRYESRDKQSYWRYVDKELQRMLTARLDSGRSSHAEHGTVGHLGFLAQKSRELEQRVATYP